MTARSGTVTGGAHDRAPGPRVLAAFGCPGRPVRLAGGRGTSWRCGDLVLKPLDGDPGSVEWAALALSDATRRTARVRWTSPVRSVAGDLVVDGWTAWTYQAGAHEPGRWATAIRAGELFSRALAELPRPAFLDSRADPWAVADRVAWGEGDLAGLDDDADVRALRAVARPVRGRPQVVHGDLTGNVLVARGAAPAVIDPSIYWRPVGYGTAIVVVDAVVHEGGTFDLLQAAQIQDELPQLLVRAALFRLLTDHLLGARSSDGAWRPVVAEICRLAC